MENRIKIIIADRLGIDQEDITVFLFDGDTYVVELRNLYDGISGEDLYHLSNRYIMGQIFLNKDKDNNPILSFTIDL